MICRLKEYLILLINIFNFVSTFVVIVLFMYSLYQAYVYLSKMTFADIIKGFFRALWSLFKVSALIIWDALGVMVKDMFSFNVSNFKVW
jgi:hypothetical protein